MEDEARKVEKYIASCYTEPDLSDVLNVEATPAVPPGENFLSYIWRLVVKIQLKNGEVKERSLILKSMLMEQKKTLSAIMTDTFIKEIMMYEEVLKKMDEIMTDFNIDGERLWSNFILHNNYKGLLLEDLKPSGFAVADKIEGLTLQEAELVFKSLGRFHAASKMAIHLGHVKSSIFRPRSLCVNTKHIEDYIVRTLHFLSQAVNESWGPQWRYIKAKLDKPTKEIVDKMLTIGEVNETRFNTILHGDLWTNNMLFQKDASGKPKSVKFVDFQLSFYNSVSWDLTYLSFTSLSHDLRKRQMNHLLKIYLDTLQDDLRRYNYPEDNIPSYEYLLNEMKRLRFYGLVTIALYVPIIFSGFTGNTEDASIIMNPSPSPSPLPEIYQSEIFRESIGEDILELLNEGVMD